MKHSLLPFFLIISSFFHIFFCSTKTKELEHIKLYTQTNTTEVREQSVNIYIFLFKACNTCKFNVIKETEANDKDAISKSHGRSCATTIDHIYGVTCVWVLLTVKNALYTQDCNRSNTAKRCNQLVQICPHNKNKEQRVRISLIKYCQCICNLHWKIRTFFFFYFIGYVFF